jgi:hypothetical protein
VNLPASQVREVVIRTLECVDAAVASVSGSDQEAAIDDLLAARLLLTTLREMLDLPAGGIIG